MIDVSLFIVVWLLNGLIALGLTIPELVKMKQTYDVGFKVFVVAGGVLSFVFAVDELIAKYGVRDWYKQGFSLK